MHAKPAATLYKPDAIVMSSPRTMIGLALLAGLVASMIGNPLFDLGRAAPDAALAPDASGSMQSGSALPASRSAAIR